MSHVNFAGNTGGVLELTLLNRVAPSEAPQSLFILCIVREGSGQFPGRGPGMSSAICWDKLRVLLNRWWSNRGSFSMIAEISGSVVSLNTTCSCDQSQGSPARSLSDANVRRDGPQ